MTTEERSRFVAEGPEQARRACEPAVRDAVERRYAEELRTAKWFRRWLLRRRMKRDMARLLDVKAPRDALYLSPSPDREPGQERRGDAGPA